MHPRQSLGAPGNPFLVPPMLTKQLFVLPGVLGASCRAYCVCSLLFINRYMRPEGPWQRLAAVLAGSSGIFIHNLILAQTDNRQF